MWDSIVKSVIQNKGLAQASSNFRDILIDKFDSMDEIKSRIDTISKYQTMRDTQISANKSYKSDNSN